MKYIKICQCCGKKFVAQKSTTRYCSAYCNNRFLKMKKRGENLIPYQQKEETEDSSIQNQFSPEDVFSPLRAAEYLGIGRSSIYRYIKQGVLPAIYLPHVTLVKKADLDNLHKKPLPYGKRLVNRNKKDEYMSVREIAEKYELTYNQAVRIMADSGIQAARYRKFDYYRKADVESHMTELESTAHPEISQWYSREDIQRIYGLTENAVYSLAFTYRLPRKRVHRVVYYSRIHVEAALGDHAAMESTFYSVEDVMEKYSITREMVYNRLRKAHIDRFMVGRVVKFRRSDFDRLMLNTITED